MHSRPKPAQDQLQDGRHQEGQQQDGHVGAGQAVGDDVADAAGLDDVAERAAGAGDQDDGAAALDAALEAVQHFLPGLMAGQTVNGDQRPATRLMMAIRIMTGRPMTMPNRM